MLKSLSNFELPAEHRLLIKANMPKQYIKLKSAVIRLPIFVDPEGFEPSTSSMPLRRAPNCAMGPKATAILTD